MTDPVERLPWPLFGLLAFAAWVGVNLLFDSMSGILLSWSRAEPHALTGAAVGVVFALLKRRLRPKPQGKSNEGPDARR